MSETFVDPSVPSASANRIDDLLALLDQLKNPDATEAKARELRELEVRVAVELENLAIAKAEHGDLDARAAMLDRRDAELRLLERSQNAKFDAARKELAALHRGLVEFETALNLRVLRYHGALGGFNSALQSVPPSAVIDRMIGVPVDVIQEMQAPNMELTKEGFGGDKFAPSTLTRSTPMSEHDDQPPPPPVRNKPPRRGYRWAMKRVLATP